MKRSVQILRSTFSRRSWIDFSMGFKASFSDEKFPVGKVKMNVLGTLQELYGMGR